MIPKQPLQSAPFQKPVSAKVPLYHDIVKNPIELSSIKDRVKMFNYYKSRTDFLRDLQLMVDNCILYNETRNPHLIPMAKHLYKIADESLNEVRVLYLIIIIIIIFEIHNIHPQFGCFLLF